MPVLDCQTAFQLAPVGMVVPREQMMLDVNDEVARTFSHPRTTMMGQSFELLYPTHDEYERTGTRIIPVMNVRGSYSDEHIMKRANSELFQCHVAGRALDHAKPLGGSVWTFEGLSAHRPVTAALTPRERDIAAWFAEGKTNEQIDKQLKVSPHTVEIYRARLMKKYAVNTSLRPMQRLMGH